MDSYVTPLLTLNDDKTKAYSLCDIPALTIPLCVHSLAEFVLLGVDLSETVAFAVVRFSRSFRTPI